MIDRIYTRNAEFNKETLQLTEEVYDLMNKCSLYPLAIGPFSLTRSQTYT